MKLSCSPLTRDQITCATAPAMATLVASRILPVIKYSARKTMVEKKSVASLANTSFIVRFLVRSSGGHGRGCGQSILRTPVLRVPLCEVKRAVAGGQPNGQGYPERQARYIDRQQVGNQHQRERAGPGPRDDVIGAQEARQLHGFGVDRLAGVLEGEGEP